jgi:O-antigen ligase
MSDQRSTSHLPVTVAALLLGIFYLSTSYAFYNLNHYKLVIAWCAVLVMLMMLWRSDWRAARQQRARLQPTAWLMLMCLLPLLTTLPGLLVTELVMEQHYAYFLGQEGALWLLGCGWMLLLIRALDCSEKLANFLVLLALITLAIATQALWNSLADYTNPQAVLAEREAGTFGNPNYLACFLAMHIPLFGLCALTAWQVVPGWRSVHVRLIFAAAALLSLFALLLTQSRVAMVALLGMVSALALLAPFMPAIFSTSIRKTATLLLALLFFAGLATAFLLPELVTSLGSELRSTPESRLVPWRAAWASIQAAPWLGWGMGSSYALFFQYVDPASRLLWQERSYAHPHNELLEILQEGGVLGLLGYGAFIALAAVAIARVLANKVLHREYKIIVIGIACAIVVYHLCGLASVDTRMAVVRMSLFTLLALLFCLWRHASDAADRSTALISLRIGTSHSSTYMTVLALLLVSAALLGRDLWSRYQYVDIMQQTNAATRTTLLQELRDTNPNVYALEQLVQAEIANGDFANATLTLDKLETLIPHYSISGYFKAVSYLLQNKEQEARVAALAYQQRDRYLPQNAYLLSKIAVMRNEPELFLQQLEILLTPALSQNVRLRGINADNVVVQGTADTTICTLTRTGTAVERLTLAINDRVVADTIGAARQAFAAADAAADYQRYIAAGVSNLACTGLTDVETQAFRAALQQILLTMAAPNR